MLNAKQIRKDIGSMPFEYWVRHFGNGAWWVSPTYANDSHRDALDARLKALGFTTVCQGVKGSSGSHIITATPNKT